MTYTSLPSLKRLFLGSLVALMSLLVVVAPARAADEVDPPDRVGRISEVNGQVWIFATDTNEWIAAGRNRPITTGDRLSTEADGRAEIRIGSSVLRVAPNTEIDVLRLDDDRMSFQLASGSLTAKLRTADAVNQFDVTTEEGRFRPVRAGDYRFDRSDKNSAVTALSGQALYEGDGTELAVQAGQRVEFWKERGVAQYSTMQPARDDFGNWVAGLDSRDAKSVSTRYVSAEMTGVEDLDRYGRWEQGTEYGAVWIPRQVATGWAPYRMGHWAWVRPWGWTWVDDAPWGFAPFHYGRWVYHRNVWCWAPGQYTARPVYAPALVAWMGGPGVSVSVSVGRAPTVGWFPLGPREVYVPGYRVSPRYVRNVNVTHVTNINVTNIINSPTQYMANTRYVNRGLPQAVTVVPAQVVERRQPVAPSVTRVNDRQLRDMARERPRADAPVGAPPRVAQNAQPAVDPRVSRPGAERRPPGPMRDQAMPGNSAAPGATPQVQRPGEAPRERVGERDRGDRADRNDRDDRGRGERAGRGNGAAVNAAPANPVAPAVVNQPAQVNQPRVIGTPRTGAESAAPRAPTVVAPDRDRATAPPRGEERRRHHEMPGPPQREVQTPRTQPQFTGPGATPPEARQPAIRQPEVRQPEVRQPEVRQPEVRAPDAPRQREVQRPPQQQPEMRQQAPARVEERGDRGDRGERGSGRVGGGDRERVGGGERERR